MIINTNIMALNAYDNLQNTQMGLSSSLEKLSSGYRINKASDDSAPSAVCTTEMPFCAFEVACLRPEICDFRP